MQHDVDREARTHHVATDETSGVCLVEGSRDALLSKCHFTTDVQEALRESGRVTRDQATLDQLMRITFHQQSVLVGARLALVAVHHEVARPHSLRRETPLRTGWETRTATTEDRRVLYFVMDGAGRLLQRLAQSFVSAGRAIPLERVGVFVLKALGDDLWAVACDETWCVGKGRHSAAFPSNHDGCATSVSGLTAPTKRSADTC